MDTSITIRPSFGRILTILVALISAAALGSLFFAGGADALRVAAFPLLLAYAAWLTLWQPHVRIAHDGVTLRNVFTSVRVPWAAIQRIDTQWALTLFTADGKHVAWAAPAPGRHAASRFGPNDVRNLPASAYEGSTVRPGDLPRSDSGDAATIIRTRWEALQHSGGSATDSTHVETRVHAADVAVLAALVGFAVLSVAL
ncbi:PH domain-containing protein [Planctomonas psychrotolerans]|uniref:PH domain-containing protein n=1 Tax=Planctomonas psychrotolerans TaxID=2528712 RepID=UPI0012397A8E|nr:PH domain-containing protein [Planctomonas psychrotolerans]